MSVLLLDTGYVQAVLRLPAGLDATAARAAARTLPGGWHLAPAGDGDGQGLPVVEVASGQPAVTCDGGTVRVSLPPQDAASAGLAYVTYTALERARQQQGKATVHATTMVAPGGGAVLLLGDKGAGKTTTALALAALGWAHAGDDLAVIGEDQGGQVTAWPGKPIAAVRDPAAPLAPKPLAGLEPFAAGPVPLRRVVRLAVRPGLAAGLSPAVPLQAGEALRLHELLARYISGLPTPLAGVGTGPGAVPYGPVWPLDTPQLAAWRSRLITALAACQLSYLHAPDAAAAAALLNREVGR